MSIDHRGLHGLVLGKFMPPHKGHCHLIDFARHFTQDVTVVVGSLAAEPIPGSLRCEWMRALFPQIRVVHLTDENPQLPHEHPEFWTIWKDSLTRVVGRPIDLVFASEEYGKRLAEVLDARFIPTNGMRDSIPVSGTEIRQSPERHWDLIPDVVKPYFTKKVLLFGPESTGKTCLAKRLAQEFSGSWVPEYARTWLSDKGAEFELADMEVIAQGQWASEQALAELGKPWLFCDTDPLTTALWCEELFGTVPESVTSLLKRCRYDLTLLLDVDVPWVQDTLRLRPRGRTEFFQRCRDSLEALGRPYQVIRGDWQERWRSACRAVKGLSTNKA